MTQIIWLTGAIGSALARRVAARQMPLMLTARDAGKLEALAATLPPHVLHGDATAGALLETAQAALGPISGFAHGVGSTLIRPLHRTAEADLQAIFQFNYFSAFHALKAFVGAALKHKQPLSAVLVGTLVAQAGFPSMRRSPAPRQRWRRWP